LLWELRQFRDIRSDAPYFDYRELMLSLQTNERIVEGFEQFLGLIVAAASKLTDVCYRLCKVQTHQKSPGGVGG